MIAARRLSVSLCVTLVLAAAATAARAEDVPANVSGTPMPEQPGAVATPRKPLMGLLDRAGVAEPLERWGVNVYGHVAGSYTYNFGDPAGDLNVGRVFDFEHDEAVFNQLNFTAERVVDVAKKRFDVGFNTTWLYGADPGTIHSNGLFDWYDGQRALGSARNSPENQWDLNQAYVDVAIPVGNGLRLRAGKFVTLLGYEVINPTGNALYSHSYLFGFAIPFTHTGVLATYNVTDKFTLNAGVTRGWEQSLEDNNDALDFLGSFNWVVSDKVSLYVSNTTGPQQAGDDGNLRTVTDVCLYYTVNDSLKLGLNGTYGFEQDVAGLGDSDWYGTAGYVHYTVNDGVAVNGRAEWFSDQDGSRGFGTNVYEVTLGLALTPFPKDPVGSNLKLRPEVRYDYAGDDLFDGGTERHQFTAAIDVLFTF